MQKDQAVLFFFYKLFYYFITIYKDQAVDSEAYGAFDLARFLRQKGQPLFDIEAYSALISSTSS
jgi:hypothetical protein